MQQLLIVGHGYAGSRFVRALHYLGQVYPNLFTVVGVVDQDPAKLTSLPPGWPIFYSLEAAIAETTPTVAIVCVNEQNHEQVLQRLPAGITMVLCEKPLTCTLQAALNLETYFCTRRLSVNFVERYSPILTKFASWRRTNPDLSLIRAEFFWGKDRIGDGRPSMGVLSEVSHPIDLVDFLTNFESWQILSVSGTMSSFVPRSLRTLASLELALQTDQCLVIGHSSFVWPRRFRNISLLFTDHESCIYQAIFDFDSPRWDCDNLKIVQTDFKKGSKKIVYTTSVRNEEFPPALEQIYKVSEFLRKSLLFAETGTAFPECVNYPQAVKIQRALEDIETALVARDTIYETSFWSLSEEQVQHFVGVKAGADDWETHEK